MSSENTEVRNTDAYEYYPIQGIPVKDAGRKKSGPLRPVPLRQNIDEWSENKANEKQVHLFVMAWDRFMKRDPSTRDSFFQVAGIHGEPNREWDEPEEAGSDWKNKGYCTHNNILFPIWHRPYLLLLEQQLYEIMINELVPNFPEADRPAWQEAAETWRLPYWDWARTNKVPKLAKYPTTFVPTFDGGVERIDNPLYQFKMPNLKTWDSEGVTNFKDPWVQDEEKAPTLYYGRCINTSRCPDEEDIDPDGNAWRYGVVNNSKVEDNLRDHRWLGPDSANYGKPMEVVYRLLTVPMEYPTFATTAQLDGKDQSVQNDLNIEYLHNTLHGWVGGDFNGHMSQIPVATFDPLFWLHHCNVDRIFAIWQALNPNKWFETGKVNSFFQDIVGLNVDDEITTSTPLRPFHGDKKGTLLTPNDVRHTNDFGYSYPELQAWNPKYSPKGRFDQTLFISDLRKYVNETYGLSRRQLLGDAQSGSTPSGVTSIPGGLKSVDFSFSIRYLRFAFGGEAFWIRLYLAQQEGRQVSATDLIGEVYNFSQRPEVNGKEVCTNCKKGQQKKVKATAYLPITPVLYSLIKEGRDLKSLTREEVLAYLQKRAYWRVVKNGKSLPRYEVEKVELEIVGGTNDATNFEDPTKAPLLENFKEEPTISGGADGAFNPDLKQPIVPPPPPKPVVPKATLPLRGSLTLKAPLETDGVILVNAPKLDLKKAVTSTIDNTQINFLTGSETLILISFRRAEGEIVFNSRLQGSYGEEVRVPLDNRFKTKTPTFLLHDQGDGYEVFIDWVHVVWFEKREKEKKITRVTYGVNESQNPVLGDALKVKVFPSLKELFHH
ncbi:hypothetical protein VTN31DRAFT_718 [Thermomyces dupontii]|uniref:uncharacterized protein n=1 Tax=Talaromyces thermophilus TaxID=28565 RepID=UPI0037424217